MAIFYQLCQCPLWRKDPRLVATIDVDCVWFAAGAASLICLAATALPLKEWSNVGFSFPLGGCPGSVVSVIALAVGQLSDSLWRPLGASTLAIAAQLLRFSFTRKFPSTRTIW